MNEAIRAMMLAQLRALYPEGMMCHTRAGRRVSEPIFLECSIGWTTNVNGWSNLFDRDGIYLSRGGENYFHIARFHRSAAICKPP